MSEVCLEQALFVHIWLKSLKKRDLGCLELECLFVSDANLHDYLMYNKFSKDTLTDSLVLQIGIGLKRKTMIISKDLLSDDEEMAEEIRQPEASETGTQTSKQFEDEQESWNTNSD